ncbi:hypothetical protein Pelo_14298 [Pelomyxa schiedti]|nr:hypothetical protein Pelo_14298 [Pelomyxa schiedti]
MGDIAPAPASTADGVDPFICDIDVLPVAEEGAATTESTTPTPTRTASTGDGRDEIDVVVGPTAPESTRTTTTSIPATTTGEAGGDVEMNAKTASEPAPQYLVQSLVVEEEKPDYGTEVPRMVYYPKFTTIIHRNHPDDVYFPKSIKVREFLSASHQFLALLMYGRRSTSTSTSTPTPTSTSTSVTSSPATATEGCGVPAPLSFPSSGMNLVAKLVWEYACVGMTRRYCIKVPERCKAGAVMITFGLSPLVMGLTEGPRRWNGDKWMHRLLALNESRALIEFGTLDDTCWFKVGSITAGGDTARSSAVFRAASLICSSDGDDYCYGDAPGAACESKKVKRFMPSEDGISLATQNRKWAVFCSADGVLTIVDLVGQHYDKQQSNSMGEDLDSDLYCVRVPVSPPVPGMRCRGLFLSKTEPDAATLAFLEKHPVDDSCIFVAVDLEKTFSLRVFTVSTSSSPQVSGGNWGAYEVTATKATGELCFIFGNTPDVVNGADAVEERSGGSNDLNNAKCLILNHDGAVTPLSKSLFCVSKPNGSYSIWDCNNLTKPVCSEGSNLLSSEFARVRVVAESGLLFHVYKGLHTQHLIQVTFPSSNSCQQQIPVLSLALTFYDEADEFRPFFEGTACCSFFL